MRTYRKLHGQIPFVRVAIVAVVVALMLLREAARDADARPGRLVLTLGFVLADLAILSVLARALDRRAPRPGITILATAATSALAGIGLLIALRATYGAPPGSLVLAGLWNGLQIYAIWIIAWRFPSLSDEARLRELEAERLAQAAEIARLREHLAPHFMRNTLNAVAALVTADPRAARRLLAALADLLDDGLATQVAARPLDAELAWLRRYAEILETRHGQALRFVWDIAPDVGAIEVPRLLIQPLVENAVQHGALARAGGGTVTVRAARSPAGPMRLTVEDNGPGVEPAAASGGGLGMELVRRRLELERPGGTFTLSSSPAGSRATVELP